MPGIKCAGSGSDSKRAKQKKLHGMILLYIHRSKVHKMWIVPKQKIK